MGHEVLDSLPFARGQWMGDQTLASPAGDGSRISQVPALPLFDTDGTNAAANLAAGRPNMATFYRPDLVGRIYASRDRKNGTGRAVLLRAVQLTNAITVGAITAATGPGRGLQFDTTHGRFGAVIATASNGGSQTAGGLGKPLDDAYPVGSAGPAGCLGYVVEEGPCTVPIAQGASATAGKEAKMAADGTFLDATDGTVVVGTWLTVPASTASGVTQGVLLVKRGAQDDRTGA